MKVSLNTVRQYIDFELPPVEELVKRINEQLGGVEEITDLATKYKDAVIVKIIEAVQHPNADHLKVTKVDDGGVTPDVPRDENGLVTVVCGAPNARPDIWAVWLPPKATVPSSFEDVEPFVLDARELRSVLSQGMLAAPDELAIGSGHDGILEINPDEWRPNSEPIVAGASFATVYGLDDTIITIENKMFTHRPDLFGQLGVAREIAGILHKPFKSPAWYTSTKQLASPSDLPLEVFNELPQKSARFMTVAIKDVTIGPSPLWLQCELIRLGGKPINNIVDVTNYVMLLTAQPTHAYDYDKIRGQKIGVRNAKKGESILLLNQKRYQLDETDIVISDGEGPIGLAGIMGGGESEVSNDTKNIILEVANFNMYAVRKSSMRHGVFTDALTRFNKGQSPLQNGVVMDLLMQSVFDVAGGAQASQLFDKKDLTHFEDTYTRPVTLSADYINSRLGTRLTDQEVTLLLEAVEFRVVNNSGITVQPPFWRTDIELPEDIVEEVGRLYGFDKLPRELPVRSAKPTAKNHSRELKQLVRESLAKAGANEVLTYSFVHEKLLDKANQSKEHAFKLSNALSPDLQYYRLSVLPSLLDRVHANSKNGYSEFALFEIGKGHSKQHYDGDLPAEIELIELIYANTQMAKGSGASFYSVRRVLDQLCSDLGISISYQLITEPIDYTGSAPFDLPRSAKVVLDDGTVLGIVGELTSDVRTSFKLPKNSAAISLSFERLLKAHSLVVSSYTPLSRFPSVTQDLSLTIANDVTYEAVLAVALQQTSSADNDMRVDISPVSIYAPESSNQKTITLRFKVTSYTKTLTDKEVTPLLSLVVEKAKVTLKASVI